MRIFVEYFYLFFIINSCMEKELNNYEKMPV